MASLRAAARGDPDQAGIREGARSDRLLHARVIWDGGGYGQSDDLEPLAVEADLVSDVDAKRLCVAGFNDGVGRAR